MDERFRALEAWLRAELRESPSRVERASTDASFRRYFRVFAREGTIIAMDAPPERENSRAFVQVAGLMRDAGLNAPPILAQASSGSLAGQPGTVPYLAALREENAAPLFGDATSALVKWQLVTREGVLPEYDEVLLRREIDLFPDWYLGRHLGVELSARQRAELEGVFAAVLAHNLAKLSLRPPRLAATPHGAIPPGCSDFQDADRRYDVACLLRDTT
jgi:aminoglycoside/choline kinase family phosphotransferase